MHICRWMPCFFSMVILTMSNKLVHFQTIIYVLSISLNYVNFMLGKSACFEEKQPKHEN